MQRNDQALTDHLIQIHRKQHILDYLTREGREHELFMALSDIEMAAHKAQKRLNELRYGGERGRDGLV